MVLRTVAYFVNGKKKKIRVKVCNPYLSLGLMFKRNSPPILFDLKKSKNFTISSIFCRPFVAIWLDEEMQATRILKIRSWNMSFSGFGKYLLEIPLDSLDQI